MPKCVGNEEAIAIPLIARHSTTRRNCFLDSMIGIVDKAVCCTSCIRDALKVACLVVCVPHHPLGFAGWKLDTLKPRDAIGELPHPAQRVGHS